MIHVVSWYVVGRRRVAWFTFGMALKRERSRESVSDSKRVCLDRYDLFDQLHANIQSDVDVPESMPVYCTVMNDLFALDYATSASLLLEMAIGWKDESIHVRKWIGRFWNMLFSIGQPMLHSKRLIALEKQITRFIATRHMEPCTFPLLTGWKIPTMASTVSKDLQWDLFLHVDKIESIHPSACEMARTRMHGTIPPCGCCGGYHEHAKKPETHTLRSVVARSVLIYGIDKANEFVSSMGGTLHGLSCNYYKTKMKTTSPLDLFFAMDKYCNGAIPQAKLIQMLDTMYVKDDSRRQEIPLLYGSVTFRVRMLAVLCWLLDRYIGFEKQCKIDWLPTLCDQLIMVEILKVRGRRIYVPNWMISTCRLFSPEIRRRLYPLTPVELIRWSLYVSAPLTKMWQEPFDTIQPEDDTLDEFVRSQVITDWLRIPICNDLVTFKAMSCACGCTLSWRSEYFDQAVYCKSCDPESAYSDRHASSVCVVKPSDNVTECSICFDSIGDYPRVFHPEYCRCSRLQPLCLDCLKKIKSQSKCPFCRGEEPLASDDLEGRLSTIAFLRMIARSVSRSVDSQDGGMFIPFIIQQSGRSISIMRSRLLLGDDDSSDEDDEEA